MIFHGILCHISPEIPPHFYRFSCRLFRPSGNFPPNSSPEALRPCLPSIINKDNSPVIRRTADRQQRNPLNYIPERKCRCLLYLTTAFSFTKNNLFINKETRFSGFPATLPNFRTHTSYHCFLHTHTVRPLL